MNIKSTVFILGLISKIYAAKFSVVSFDGACQLNVNGQVFDMIQEDPGVPLYSISADVPLQSKYNYICGGVVDVERTLIEENTHNELVGRALTVYDMPEFGYPNAKPWTRSIGRTELFDPDYVPIVIVNESNNYFAGPTEKPTIFDSMTFILKDNVFTFNNVSARGKNFDEDKFQFKVDLPNGGIYHRDVLKFRPSSFDPAFFRQILYGDIAHAIGNPAHESVAARVYLSDGTGIGLYVLQEDCTTESFIRTAFYGNEQTGEVSEFVKSPIYDCSTGADFNVNDSNQLGSFKNDTDDFKIELLEMTRQIDILDIMNDEAVKNFDENWLELDTLFRALALEYLAGHWDSYWFLTTNFVVYHPAEETEGVQYSYTKYKYYFIDQDFDQTWGSNMKATLDGSNYPYKPYTEWVNKDVSFWQTINADEVNDDGKLKDPGTRVILNKFLGCDGQPTCSTKTYFEDHLKSIVQHIFNPVAMKVKTDGYKTRLNDEVLWDTQLTRLHAGTRAKFHFTYDDFVNNIERGVGAFPFGILDWTAIMADNVCNQFSIQYDSVPYDPATAAQQEVQAIEPGTTYDANTNLNVNSENKSGAAMTGVNMVMVAVATILSVVLLF